MSSGGDLQVAEPMDVEQGERTDMPAAELHGEKQFYRNRWRISFVGEIETRYRRYCARRDRRYIRNLLNILILMYIGYGACDWLLLQDQVSAVWWVRYGIGLPCLTLLWGLTRLRHSERYIDKLVVGGLVMLSVSTLAMVRVVPVPVMDLYLSSVLAIVMAGLTITRLRFWYSVFTGLVFLLAVVILVPSIHENVRYLVYYILLSFGVVVFCWAAQFTSDRSSRREFLQKVIIHRKNAQLRKVNLYLRDLAEIDALTGIANRRYFDAVLDEEWRRARRRKYNVALLMCDIDFFKSYNDLLGHVQGDVCIRDVAQCIRKLVRRPGDLVARYGGEEFAVILPALDVHEAQKIAEAVCQSVRDLNLPHPGSGVRNVVTISVGVAAMIPDGADLKQLITQADEALYQAKHQGRDRVCSHSI